MTIQHMARSLEIQSLKGDGTFVGYASVFDVVDSHKEIVAKGAFRKSLANWQLKDAGPSMLWMHDPTVPIGVWIGMGEDYKGLVVHGRLAVSTQKGKEAYELLKMKALTGLSIGYRVVKSNINRLQKVRVLTEVDLFEVSLVTFPSNDQARVVSIKSPEKKNGKIRKVEKTITNAAAKRLNAAAKHLKQKPLRKGSKYK